MYSCVLNISFQPFCLLFFRLISLTKFESSPHQEPHSASSSFCLLCSFIINISYKTKIPTIYCSDTNILSPLVCPFQALQGFEPKCLTPLWNITMSTLHRPNCPKISQDTICVYLQVPQILLPPARPWDPSSSQIVWGSNKPWNH